MLNIYDLVDHGVMRAFVSAEKHVCSNLQITCFLLSTLLTVLFHNGCFDDFNINQSVVKH